MFQHTVERGVKFTALLVCCNHPQKYTTSVVTSFDTHHFQSSHLSLVPYIDTPLSLSSFGLVARSLLSVSGSIPVVADLQWLQLAS